MLINSKVVDQFRYGVEIRDLECNHAECALYKLINTGNMPVISMLINNQYASNIHANKQLVHSQNWSLN